jgi:anaerobic selenocysteine-containing dehydrogenase
VVEALKRAQILLLDGDNPVYSLPVSSGLSQALARIDTIVSFGPFINDSASHADIVLPDHHILESASAVLPAVSPRPAITVAMPFVRPLYNTRAIEQTLGDIARKMDITFEPATPKSYVEPLLPVG